MSLYFPTLYWLKSLLVSAWQFEQSLRHLSSLNLSSSLHAQRHKKKKIHHGTQTCKHSSGDFIYPTSSKTMTFCDIFTGDITSVLCSFFHAITFKLFSDYLQCARPVGGQGSAHHKPAGLIQPKGCLINKVHWNPAIVIHLRIAYGCFLAAE